MGVEENKNKLIPWVDDHNQQRQLDSNPRSLFNQHWIVKENKRIANKKKEDPVHWFGGAFPNKHLVIAQKSFEKCSCIWVPWSRWCDLLQVLTPYRHIHTYIHTYEKNCTHIFYIVFLFGSDAGICKSGIITYEIAKSTQRVVNTYIFISIIT